MRALRLTMSSQVVKTRQPILWAPAGPGVVCLPNPRGRRMRRQGPAGAGRRVPPTLRAADRVGSVELAFLGRDARQHEVELHRVLAHGVQEVPAGEDAASRWIQKREAERAAKAVCMSWPRRLHATRRDAG